MSLSILKRYGILTPSRHCLRKRIKSLRFSINLAETCASCVSFSLHSTSFMVFCEKKTDSNKTMTSKWIAKRDEEPPECDKIMCRFPSGYTTVVTWTSGQWCIVDTHSEIGADDFVQWRHLTAEEAKKARCCHRDWTKILRSMQRHSAACLEKSVPTDTRVYLESIHEMPSKAWALLDLMPTNCDREKFDEAIQLLAVAHQLLVDSVAVAE